MHLLSDVKTIALVGLSRDKKKTSRKVAAFLKQQGYTIIPVNPFANTILNERVYPTVKDIPQNIDIDVVILFRPSEKVFPLIKEAIERGNIKTIWLPEGIQHPEGEKLAFEHGISVFSNVCIMKCFNKP